MDVAAPARTAGRLRLLFFAALAVTVAAVSVQYAAKTAKPGRTGEQTRSAFLRWRPQIQGMEQGVNVYAAHNYPNPPVMALVLWPFTELPPFAGALAWFYLKVLLAAVAFVWVFRLVETPGVPFPPGAKAAAVLLSLHPLLGDLSHGNVNIFILFLVAATLELYRRGRDASAGVVLALAVACKVTPLLFVPYFAWKGAWRVLAGWAAGMVLWLLLMPGAALGWSENLTLLGSWFDTMVRPFVLDGKVTTEHPNQSIPGVIHRLLTNGPSFIAYDDETGRPVPAAYHNLADIGPAAAKGLAKGCMGLFALLVVLGCRATGRSGWRPAAEVAFVALGMLLFSERTWKHHAVTLVLPYSVLAYVLATQPLGPARRRFLFGTLAAAMVLTWVPSLLGGKAADAALVYGVYTLVFVAVTVAIASLLFARPPATTAPTSRPATLPAAA